MQFCDNSLLVLKMRFQAFSFASKKIQGFSSDRKILMSLLSVLFHLQNRASIFSQDIWGSVNYVPEINLIQCRSEGTSSVAFEVLIINCEIYFINLFIFNCLALNINVFIFNLFDVAFLLSSRYK